MREFVTPSDHGYNCENGSQPRRCCQKCELRIMLLKPCENYKVVYNQDDILDIKSKVKSGIATLTEADLEIKGNDGGERCASCGKRRR